MSNKSRAKSLIEKKLGNPEYRKRHEEQYEAFKLEVQILQALEEKGWSYSDLAAATYTSKSNVSRDLKAGGIFYATFSRISKIAEALGMKLIALLIPKNQVQFILPKIEELVRTSFNATVGQIKMTEQLTLSPANLKDAPTSNQGLVDFKLASDEVTKKLIIQVA